MLSRYLLILLLWSLISINGYSQDENIHCLCYLEGDNSPAGLMGVHTHEKNAWMVSYTYMRSNQLGNQWGSNLMADQNVLDKYLMAPQSMNMDMHMLMLMYGITDHLSVMAMGTYAVNSMSMLMINTLPMHMYGMPDMTMTAAGMMNSKLYGINDAQLFLNYSLIKTEHHTLIISSGLNVPIANIQKKNNMSLASLQDYTYMMQLGSGTWDILPRVSYVFSKEKLFLGMQAGANFHTGYNSLGYRAGDQYSLTAWTAYRVLKPVGVSLRALYVQSQSISGVDPNLNPWVEPGADIANYGSSTLFILPGFNIYPGFINGATIGMEYGLPIYQYFHGIQMPYTNQWNIKAQIAF